MAAVRATGQARRMTLELKEYARNDAIGLRELITSGEITAAEVEAVARRALDAANAEVNGLAAPLFVPALHHAADGPLTGVPFLIKDFGPMAAGVPFFCGSRGVPGVRPDHDSDLMTRVRAAGLVTLGLTTAPELGLGFATEPLRTGPTRNPWDLERGVGGSSGGAAALVAAGAVPIAHGSDGAGSLRIPASCCGLVGLKPSRGRTPSGPDGGSPLFGLTVHFGLSRKASATPLTTSTPSTDRRSAIRTPRLRHCARTRASSAPTPAGCTSPSPRIRGRARRSIPRWLPR